MAQDLITLDPLLLQKWNIAVPRYTSYPTAPQFAPIEASLYLEKLKKFDASEKPLSLYLHIPFCKTMCLFCACSVVLNRKPEKQSAYLSSLLKEIALLPFTRKRKVAQIHFGGGTPTSLAEEEFEILFRALQERFCWGEGDEVSIEIDPRTVFADGGKKLRFLKGLGFNRVSFGVQDLDPKVQEAVKRRQSEEMTVKTYEMARELGFWGINLDLIYGLPHQSVESFRRTSEKILEMRPDRIALFSYAKVPWLKAHQKAIEESALPTSEEKFQIYVEARERFMQGGYVAIGMDHFSLPEDSIAKAYAEKRLTRNFQGYSLHLADDMLGLGVSSIGCIEESYFQNAKTIEEYTAKVEAGALPAEKGYVLTKEDRIRKFVIQRLMCHFEVDKGEFLRLFYYDFDLYFLKEREAIERLKGEGLLEEDEGLLWPTPLGRLFIRVIAVIFDAHFKGEGFSRAI